ncbi:ferritin-like domain-containing protein [Amycolatopsis sp. NPDC004747]
MRCTRSAEEVFPIEHSTIPPYLCALYSLDPARNPEATQVVGTVLADASRHWR